MLADVVDRADVRVIEPGRRLRFAPEALKRGVVRDVLRKKLERDAPAQANILGVVDDAHSAAAELREHAIVRDHFADHGDFEG